jgi:hypothetical protein
MHPGDDQTFAAKARHGKLMTGSKGEIAWRWN